jgi:hypothetical protein
LGEEGRGWARMGEDGREAGRAQVSAGGGQAMGRVVPPGASLVVDAAATAAAAAAA